MAWSRGIPILGLYAKGEDFGLMRKMMDEWFERYTDILKAIEKIENKKPHYLSTKINQPS